MTEDRAQVPWPRCQTDSGCPGSALSPWSRCLAHLDPPDLDQAIKRAKTEGLDVRGATVTPLLLERIFSLLGRTDQGTPIVPDAQFDQVTFTGDARFRGATFTGDARFRGATFDPYARFEGVTFTGDARFDEAIFIGRAAFFGATFDRLADFGGATFTGDAWFDQRTPTGRARFCGDARFRGVTFRRDARFEGATFDRFADFGGATFTGDAAFDGVSLSGELSLRSARPAKRLRVALRRSSAGEIDPTVDLKEASFAGPAMVAASPGGAVSRRPKLVSVEQTDTANLTVAGLNLSDCRFLGAINLERLRIDGPLLLRRAPGWWQARRWVLREEGELRGWPGWATPDRQDGPAPNRDRGERASRLQAVYRELRKGREDAKDEPGAADFYYGEMEMRRKAASGVERWLLTSYWAVSGYGLRASRAVIALLVLLAGATVGFRAIGGDPQRSWRDTSLYVVRTSTSLLRSTAVVPLTRWGQLIEIALRLLAPVLLGLAVLAVRGRIKR